MENEPINFLSVCSGIEAASVAWEPLGWKAAAVSEIDPFPCHVLHHRLGATRPMFMPDPEAGGIKLKDRRARAAAIRAVQGLPETGTVPNLGDMTQFKEWPDLGTVDLLVGGTPCQSFSVAGLRKGLDDPRGNLALTYLAIADRYRPKWVVWENVPGVLSSSKGRDFGSFLGGLGQLGYGFAYRVLDAQYIRTRRLPFAVPQRRRRVFVVGCLGDWRPAAAVLFDGQSLRGDPAPRRKAGKSVAPTLSARTRGGGGLGTDFDVDGGLIPAVAARMTAFGQYEVDGTASTVKSRDYKDATDLVAQPVAHALRAEGFDASEDGTGRGPPIVPVSFDSKASSPQANESGVAPTLRAMSHANSHANAGGQLAVAHPVAIQERAVCENPSAGPDGMGCRTDGAAYTLEARTTTQAVAFAQNTRDEVRLVGGDGGDGGVAGALAADAGMKQTTYVAEPTSTRWAVRRLTPTECERLQGFPDGHTSIPYRTKKKVTALELLYIRLTHPGISLDDARMLAADGPRYKALGNSMATNAMEFLGTRIEHVREVLSELDR